MIYGFGTYRLVAACRETPVVFPNVLNRHAITVRAFLAAWPFGEQVGNIVGLNRRALVIEAETVGGQVIEPN